MVKWAVTVKYGPYAETHSIEAEEDEMVIRGQALFIYRKNELQRIYPLANVASVKRIDQKDNQKEN